MRYLNPSPKYLSTTMITSMSTVIHQILVKKNLTKPVRFWWPLTFGPIDRCAAILISLLISCQIESWTMLCWLAENHNSQLEKIVSNFEITIKRIFSVAGRMFEPDRCRLTDKIFEAKMFINCNKDFKNSLPLFNKYLQFWCSGVIDVRVEGRFDSAGQLNVKTRHP